MIVHKNKIKIDLCQKIQMSRPAVQVVEFREPGTFARPAPAAFSGAPGGLKRARAPEALPATLAPGLKRALQGVASKRSVWASVAELGASGFQDAKRKALGSAALVAVGARPAAQQRMPFKMYLGVSRARKERSDKAAERARVSGVVLPKVKRKARKVRERAAPDEPVPQHIRGSVMHAKQ